MIFKDIQVGRIIKETRIVSGLTNITVNWEVKEQLEGSTRLKIVGQISPLDALVKNTLEIGEPYSSEHSISIFNLKENEEK